MVAKALNRIEEAKGMYGAREPPVETMQALLELLEADQLFAAICANRAALAGRFRRRSRCRAIACRMKLMAR
jgi:hypothetical protein